MNLLLDCYQKLKYPILILAISLLALLLRVYQVARYPQSLYWDEVSIGYNAYSLVQTGKDEWGVNWPLFFEAFNEYKFPVPIYLVAIAIKFFGYTDFAVRLPGVILGSASVVLIYFVSGRILENKSKRVCLLSSFFAAISFWHLQFSRPYFEGGIAFFFICGYLFFLVGFLKEKKSADLFFSILFAGLTLYSYSPAIFIVPVWTLVLIFFWWSARLREKTAVAGFFLMALLLLLIPFFVHIKKHGFSRFDQVSAFNQNPILEKVIAQRAKYGELSKLIFNRYVANALVVGKNLLTIIDPRFYFPGTDQNGRHNCGKGLIYPVEFIFIAVSLLTFWQRWRKFFYLLLLMLVVGMMPSAITQDNPNALRSLFCLLPIIFLSTTGLFEINKRKQFLSVFFAVVMIVLFHSYLGHYYLVYAKESFFAWGGENSSIMKKALELNVNNRKIYFTGDYWRPYIFYYHYFRINPRQVQQNDNSTKIGDVYFGYANFDHGDRRYNYSFSLDKFPLVEKAILFLSPREEFLYKDLLDKFKFEKKGEIIENNKDIAYYFIN